MKIAIALFAALALAGCQSMTTAMSYNYTPVQFPMEDDTYRVFEHPTEDKIMTTSSLGRAIGGGAVKGATLGLANVYTEEQLHERAARAYLDQNGRANCPIVRGYLLMQPQYEFWYECPA